MKVSAIHRDIWDFIKKLEPETYAETLRVISFLEEKGHEIRMPYSKKLTKNIYELRIKEEQVIRIFYTFYNNEAVLLHIIAKNKQKLSPKDLQTAINREK